MPKTYSNGGVVKRVGACPLIPIHVFACYSRGIEGGKLVVIYVAACCLGCIPGVCFGLGVYEFCKVNAVAVAGSLFV